MRSLPDPSQDFFEESVKGKENAMFSLPVIILSALILVLSSAVAILGFQLYTAKKNRRETCPCPDQTKNAEAAAMVQKRERAAALCMDIKRRLTHICATIPSAAPGLKIERVRLLCADELKDKVTAVSNIFEKGFSDRFIQKLDQQDSRLLDEQLDQLATIAEDVKHIDLTLAPIFKAWSGGSAVYLDDDEKGLIAISGRLDKLHQTAASLLRSAAQKLGAGEALPSVQERVRRASLTVSDSAVRAAMADLEMLVRRHYDSLDGQTKARVESYYLETLELVLDELGQAEQAGEDTSTRAELSVRVIRVLSNIMGAGQKAQGETRKRNLEAEVVALERLAAMRGDV